MSVIQPPPLVPIPAAVNICPVVSAIREREIDLSWIMLCRRTEQRPDFAAQLAAQIPELHWVRLVGKTGLPFSVGALVNEIAPRMGIANGLAAVGYSAMGSVPVPDCGCTDVWRCRCDFDTHPFRHADADLWPQYGLIGFQVRYQTSWSLMWLLDTGVAAVWVAEDLTTTAPVPAPITRRCYLEWCDTCPGQARPAPDADPAPCACHCHQKAATAAS